MIQGYLTTKEAGNVIGISDARIRQLVLDGRLRAVKLGNMVLIKQSALARFQQKRNGKRKVA